MRMLRVPFNAGHNPLVNNSCRYRSRLGEYAQSHRDCSGHSERAQLVLQALLTELYGVEHSLRTVGNQAAAWCDG